MSNPAPKFESAELDEVRAKLETRVKGGDVGRIGNSLAFVLRDRMVHTFGDVLAKDGWTVSAVIPNHDSEETLVTVSPVEEVLQQ